MCRLDVFSRWHNRQVGVAAHVLVGLYQAMLGLPQHLPLLVSLLLATLFGAANGALPPPGHPRQIPRLDLVDLVGGQTDQRRTMPKPIRPLPSRAMPIGSGTSIAAVTSWMVSVALCPPAVKVML